MLILRATLLSVLDSLMAIVAFIHARPDVSLLPVQV